jgi:transposase-like protein
MASFKDVIILLCVRHYLRYSLSYCDLEEMIKAGIIDFLITDHGTAKLLMRYESD